MWGVEDCSLLLSIGIGLNGDSKTYETLYSLAAGWTGKTCKAIG